MVIRTEIGPVGSPNAILDDSDLIDVDVVRPHTALADYDIGIPYRRDMRDRALERVRVYAGGDIIFRGYLRDLQWDQQRGTTRLNGPGIGDDLRDSAIERSFVLTRTDEAIRQVWADDTDFDATVYDQPGNTIISDETAQEVRTDESFDDLLSGVDPTAPLVADGNLLKPAQTGFFKEAENASGGGSTRTDSDYSNGEAVEVNDIADDVSFRFSNEYTIPAGNAAFAYRINAENGTHPGYDVLINGERADSVFEDAYNSGLQWRTGSDISSELPPGTYTAEIDVTDTGGTMVVDCLYVYDERYYPTFDDSTDSNGYLSGPGLYPDQLTPDASRDSLAFPEEDQDYNVEQASIDVTMAQGSSANLLQARLNQGPWYPQDGSEQDTTSIETDFSGDNGTSLQAVIDIGATSATRTTATPTENYQPEAIEQYRFAYAVNDVSIIEDQTYRGSPLSILTDLHERADFRFVIDHAATDSNGNLTKRVESFESGTETRPADWSVVNRRPKLSYNNYANEVTVYGALQSDGTRPKRTIEAGDEVDANGREPYFEVRPDLTTGDQLRAAAIDLLSAKLNERDESGRLRVLPTDVLPGYSYDVEWFADGELVQTPLERVQFSVSNDQMRGVLKFNRDEDVPAELIQQSKAIDETREGI